MTSNYLKRIEEFDDAGVVELIQKISFIKYLIYFIHLHKIFIKQLSSSKNVVFKQDLRTFSIFFLSIAFIAKSLPSFLRCTFTTRPYDPDPIISSSM